MGIRWWRDALWYRLAAACLTITIKQKQCERCHLGMHNYTDFTDWFVRIPNGIDRWMQRVKFWPIIAHYDLMCWHLYRSNPPSPHHPSCYQSALTFSYGDDKTVRVSHQTVWDMSWNMPHPLTWHTDHESTWPKQILPYSVSTHTGTDPAKVDRINSWRHGVMIWFRSVVVTSYSNVRNCDVSSMRRLN